MSSFPSPKLIFALLSSLLTYVPERCTLAVHRNGEGKNKLGASAAAERGATRGGIKVFPCRHTTGFFRKQKQGWGKIMGLDKNVLLSFLHEFPSLSMYMRKFLFAKKIGGGTGMKAPLIPIPSSLLSRNFSLLCYLPQRNTPQNRISGPSPPPHPLLIRQERRTHGGGERKRSGGVLLEIGPWVSKLLWDHNPDPV